MTKEEADERARFLMDSARAMTIILLTLNEHEPFASLLQEIANVVNEAAVIVRIADRNDE